MLSSHSYQFFFSLLLSALNDLTGPSAGPLAQITYSIPLYTIGICHFEKVCKMKLPLELLQFCPKVYLAIRKRTKERKKKKKPEVAVLSNHFILQDVWAHLDSNN